MDGLKAEIQDKNSKHLGKCVCSPDIYAFPSPRIFGRAVQQSLSSTGMIGNNAPSGNQSSKNLSSRMQAPSGPQ
jgi:hypothetical protein